MFECRMYSYFFLFEGTALLNIVDRRAHGTNANMCDWEH